MTMAESFDAEGLVVVLESLPLFLDVVGVDGVDGVIDGILEGFITLTAFLHCQLIQYNVISPYANCCSHDYFFVASNKL